MFIYATFHAKTVSFGTLQKYDSIMHDVSNDDNASVESYTIKYSFGMIFLSLMGTDIFSISSRDPGDIIDRYHFEEC